MNEQEIREAAYLLWEKQGKPQGKDLENWFTAEHLAENNNTDTAGSQSMPRTSSENEPNGEVE